ncbi:LysR family transcriptional regulator [Buttiauxella agrestis]
MKIKLNQLDILLEVAAQGSIGKAAKALHLTQPAISKTIQEMEAEIGMPILQRSSRGVTLNEYGQVLLRHAQTLTALCTRHVMKSTICSAKRCASYGWDSPLPPLTGHSPTR